MPFGPETTLESVREVSLAKPGYVYLVLSSRTGHYKIGYTRRPWERMGTLKSEAGHACTLVHTIFSNCTPLLELEMHRRFADKRVRGEWFALAEDDLAHAQSVSLVLYTRFLPTTERSGYRRYAIDYKRAEVRGFVRRYKTPRWYPICGCVRGVPIPLPTSPEN